MTPFLSVSATSSMTPRNHSKEPCSRVTQ
uniref:RBOHD n=1 Tax=Arundo donax TaxID=35708 RepID=A0A0A9FMK4_ARUDO